MSKSKKIILGILTFLPLILLILYFVLFFSMFLKIPQANASGEVIQPDEILGAMGPLFAILGTMVLVSIGLVVYYLVDIFQYNPKFKSGGNSRLMWTLIVLLAGMIGMIVYFFAEIVPRKELPPLPHNPNL